MKTPYYTTTTHINPPLVRITSLDTEEIFFPTAFAIYQSRHMEGFFSNVVNTSVLVLKWEAPKHGNELVFTQASFVSLDGIPDEKNGGVRLFEPAEFAAHFTINGSYTPIGVARELLQHAASCHNTQFNYLRSFYVDRGDCLP